MARYDHSYDARFHRGPGPRRREQHFSPYDRDFGSRPIRIQHAGQVEHFRPRGRYDASYRTYGGDRGFAGRGYDRGYGRDFGGRYPRRGYDRELQIRGAGRPVRGNEPGGIFDPFTGPFRPDRGISNLSAGRPGFFTDYGGGEQTGNHTHGLY